MFYGHAEPDRFTEEAEKIVTAIASQAAIAIDNARLYQAAQKEIFERTQVEQALRISEARYRNLIHALPVAIYTCDAEGRVTLWNEAAVRLWGRDPVAGSDRWCGSWKCHRPDGSPLPLDASPMAVTLREGRAVRGQEIIMERPDGSRRHVLPHTDPLRGPDGALAGAVSLLLDITEQKEAAQAMAHLASIVTSSDDAIISKTLQGVVTSWNKGAERVFGYTAEEMIGQPIIRLIPPDRPNEEPSILERLARGESIDHYETVRRRKDGRLIDISLSVSPMRDANGSIMGASKIARDITDRKRAEAALQAAHEELTRRQQELVEANRELESFSYSVSHDLRAPIRTIDAFSRILSEDHGAGLDGEATRCLDIVKKAASQAGELIDDLLEFSRLGRQGLQHEAVDMKAIVQEVVEDLQALQLDRRIEWRVQDLPRAWGDRRLLRIVWNNLLSNALKYTQYRAEAIIEVGCRPDGDRGSSIIYFVKDNGVGFDMKYAHKLFGVFQRLHRKEEYEGTGVGLAIVQRIVHRHGGRVWAESAPDAGAAFYFSLGKADQ
jgi:PAS domain S-box-containing protein